MLAAGPPEAATPVGSGIWSGGGSPADSGVAIGAVGVMKPRRRFPRANLLAGLRIRLKLIVLHTVFSLLLAGVLWLALRPAIAEVIRQAEAHEAGVLLAVVRAEQARSPDAAMTAASPVVQMLGPGVDVRVGRPEDVGLDDAAATALVSGGDSAGASGSRVLDDRGAPVAAAYDPRTRTFTTVRVVLSGARESVGRLYLLLAVALGLVYLLVAVALEIFVLPQHVYGPIRTMLRADLALREGRRDQELIPAAAIPADELGEIMLSRNESVIAIRQHEQDLAEALGRLEEVATDLARKNHLLEAAKRNMAESDRLASLGLMSAGIAHELNTPLAVLKGLVEKLHRCVGAGAAFKAGGSGGAGAAVTPEEAALMVRVVGRLERLSESLLDFARVRPGHSGLGALVEEAWTLVRLDREAQAVEVAIVVPSDLSAFCDADRIVQVLVNLLRNSVDAMAGARTPRPRIVVAGETVRTGDGQWASLTITDSGPGIDAA
ncbi:MAG: HAMP domain-containing histidine kinase, partial [Phycisphaerales bacterium]|nr:HAMP domain-containing histidine kinase [Phycisphaerales bacterium]